MKAKNNFLQEFNRVKSSIQKGTTPVFSEIRNAKTALKELVPYLIIQSILLVASTLIINQFNLDNVVMLVIMLVVNTTTATVSQCTLVFLKHLYRIMKLKRYGLEVSEENLAVLESMEYQSV